MSPDSVIDEARGLVFPARIKLTGSQLQLDRFGARGTAPATKTADPDALPGAHLLSPGLSAAVEIKTGKRSVLSFLLSPIAKAVNEAGRER